jgi:RecA/RadA recombinase
MAAHIPAEKLASAFEALINRDFGQTVAPAPYITPSGFGRHVDEFLGGGFTSSIPVLFTSTPESGKSTAAFQFAANFLQHNKNSVVVYLDIENAAAANDESSISSRIDTFRIDRSKFLYKPLVAHLEQVFEIIDSLVGIKKKLEENTGEEYRVLFIWDSLAGTPLAKETQVDDPNQVIGLKARILTHQLAKYKSTLLMNKVTLLIIDQIRSNIQIQNPYAPREEKGVGGFGQSFKAATNVNALQHAIGQWIFLSKREVLNPMIDLGVDGWSLELSTEKNKLAPSQYSVTVVLDKKYGIDPIISEYWFMSNMSRWEVKMTKNTESKLVYPLAVSVEGRSKVISVFDPKTKQVIKKSEKFTEKNFYEKYYTDAKFKELFDEAVETSVNYRIRVGYFREQINGVVPPPMEEPLEETPEIIETSIQDDSINYMEPESEYTMSE